MPPRVPFSVCQQKYHPGSIEAIPKLNFVLKRLFFRLTALRKNGNSFGYGPFPAPCQTKKSLVVTPKAVLKQFLTILPAFSAALLRSSLSFLNSHYLIIRSIKIIGEISVVWGKKFLKFSFFSPVSPQ
jgi:hypothetical protein